jgi:BirA family transcriptional regulator, biotin operon repressor / biotin---[acetyl-CoA-carboxylase] ligase
MALIREEELAGWRLLTFDELGSTMTEAAQRARSHAPHATLIRALRQTAGVGRYGRRWDSASDEGLWVTAILRPRCLPEDLPLITLTLGLALREAIQQWLGITADLRWPNDLMLAERKLAGILTTMDQGAVLAGIGVNINQLAFPAELENIAISLRQHLAAPAEPAALLPFLLPSIDAHLRLLEQGGRPEILRLFSMASSFVLGRRVSVDLGGHAETGTTDGLDEAGFLRLRRDDGSRTTILAGGVRPL